MFRRMLMLGACASALLGAGASSAMAADVATCPEIVGTANGTPGTPGTFAFAGGGTCVFDDDQGQVPNVYTVSVTMNGNWTCTAALGTSSTGVMKVTGMSDDGTPITATADYSLTFAGVLGTLTLANTKDNDPDATVTGNGGGAFVAGGALCSGSFQMAGGMAATWDDN